MTDAQPKVTFRDDRHRAFTQALQDRLGKVMQQSGETLKQVADRIGVEETALGRWRKGRLPTVRFAEALGEVLGERVGDLLVACWATDCRECGKRFVSSARGGSMAMYCGRRCKDLASFRRRQAKGNGVRTFALHRLSAVEESIARHCRTCTGGLAMCPLWSCDLQYGRDGTAVPVSPIPLDADAVREYRRRKKEEEAA